MQLTTENSAIKKYSSAACPAMGRNSCEAANELSTPRACLFSVQTLLMAKTYVCGWCSQPCCTLGGHLRYPPIGSMALRTSQASVSLRFVALAPARRSLTSSAVCFVLASTPIRAVSSSRLPCAQ